MGIIDIVIIGLMLISTLIGLIRGFTRELMSITGWIISIYLAMNFHKPVGAYFSKFVNNEAASDLIGGGAIFIVSLFVFSMIGFFVSRAVAASKVRGTDRTLGAALGIVRGVLIIGFIIVIASIFNVENRDAWKNSKLVGYFEPIAATINSILPEKFKVSSVDEALDSAKSLKKIIDLAPEGVNTTPDAAIESATKTIK